MGLQVHVYKRLEVVACATRYILVPVRAFKSQISAANTGSPNPPKTSKNLDLSAALPEECETPRQAPTDGHDEVFAAPTSPGFTAFTRAGGAMRRKPAWALGGSSRACQSLQSLLLEWV